MKKAIVAMLLMAVFLLGGGGLISIVFSSIAGGGVEQSFIYPIYAGIIVLAGLICNTSWKKNAALASV